MDKFGQHDLPSGLLGRLSGGADAFDDGLVGTLLLEDFFETGPGTDNLTASNLATAAPTLDTPALGQIHALTAATLTAGTPTLGTPTLTEDDGTDDLLADGVTAGTPTLGAPAIGQAHVLNAVALAAGAPSLGNPTIAQIHALLAGALNTGTPTLGSPALDGAQPEPPPEIHTGGAWSWKPLPEPPRKHQLFAASLHTSPPTLGMPALTVSLGPEQIRRRKAALIAALH